MEETIKNTAAEELEGQMHFEEYEDDLEILYNGDAFATEENSSNVELKGAIEEQLRKIQRQNMLIGAQTVCTVILEKIMTAMSRPGKRTMNDYKRIIKDIEQFCRIGVSRKINSDGETEPIEEESVDNNSTKLMEETDEGNTNESN